jgi:hypothetical protein
MFLRLVDRFALAAISLSTLVARPAMAGGAPTAAQLTAARALFMAAEKDEDADRWSDALEKLQRVAQVKLTSGVRYHIALCEEHLGRLVAALADYKAAAAQAHADNAGDVLRLVDRRVTDSAERIPRLIVVLVPSVPDATVRLDGELVDAGTSVAADPGSHALEVQAPGFTPSSTTVTLQERDAARVELKLEQAPPPPAAPAVVAAVEAHPTPAPENVSPPGGRTLALVAAAGAVGLAAGGVGAYLAAGSVHTSSVQACAQVISFQTDACDSHKNAVRAWDWVGIGAWTGAAAFGTVAVLSFVRSHRDAGHASGDHARGPASSPTARVVVGPASMDLEGTF